MIVSLFVVAMVGFWICMVSSLAMKKDYKSAYACSIVGWIFTVIGFGAAVY